MDAKLRALPPIEAVAFFKQKGHTLSFAWQDVWQEEHSKAFTVAKMMNVSLLNDTRAILDRAIADGLTFEEFRAEVKPKLVAAGWWGKQEMKDPATGEIKKVQLGSNKRLRTIFRTNIRMSYSVGKWQKAQSNKAALPYARYDAVDDNITRYQHRMWDNIILHIDHPWWDTHWPLNGWHCRCDVILYSLDMLSRRGLKVSKDPPQGKMREFVNKRTGETMLIEDGLDPAFAYNPGKAPMRGITAKPIGTPRNDEQTTNAITEFLAGFGSGLFIDKGDWPIAINKGLFQNQNNEMVLPNDISPDDLALIATVLKTAIPEWLWHFDEKAGTHRLKRRFTKALDNRKVTIDFKDGVWTVEIVKTQ